MPDPLAPLSPGDPLPTSSRTWNAILRAASAHRQPHRPDQSRPPVRSTGYVEALALNNTGSDLREHKPAAVVGAGGYDLLDDGPAAHWLGRPCLTLDTPTGPGDHIAVTLEAIPAGRFGRVAVSGWCAVDVDVTDAAHRFAAPSATAGTDALVSGGSGPVRIIPTGTGTARRTQAFLFAGAGGQCDDYPMVWRQATGKVDFAGQQVQVRDVSIDETGCVTVGPPYCLPGESCSEVEDKAYWCIEGTCWTVYDGIEPEGGVGPYPTRELCAEVCGLVASSSSAAPEPGPVGLGCCPLTGVPSTLYITLSGGNGTVTMTHDGTPGGVGYWYGSKALSGCTVYFRISEAGGCAGIEYSRNQVTWFAATCLNGEDGCTITCEPFSVSGTYTFSSTTLGLPCSFGTITGTLAA